MMESTNRQTPSLATAQSPSSRALPGLVFGLAALVFVSWLLNTPEGVLGKADAVGYAICHRIDARSFHLGDRALPLCARCTGIYLGALLSMGLVAVLGRNRAGALPPRWIIAVLLGFVAVMGFDGINSYLTLFPGMPHLYEPNNGLRMITGTFNGLAIGAFIYPIFTQTAWVDWENRPAVGSARNLLVLVGAGLIVIGLALTENPLVLYPLALLSTLGVVVLLTLLDTIILLVVMRREGRAASWPGLILPLLAGFTLAMLQIGVVDALRFAIFGTWDGFSFPGGAG